MDRSEMRLLAQQIRARVPIPVAAKWVNRSIEDFGARHPCPKCERSSTSRQTLAVFDDGERWYCYHCREGGDVIDYLAAVQQCASGAVIAETAARLGLSGNADAFVQFIESEMRSFAIARTDKNNARDIKREFISKRHTRTLHSDSEWVEVVAGYWFAERASLHGNAPNLPIHYPMFLEPTPAHRIAKLIHDFYRMVESKGRSDPEATALIQSRDLAPEAIAGPVSGKLLPAYLDRMGCLKDAACLGLCGRESDPGAKRVVFPIHDFASRVCAFAYRAVRKDDSPKYRNSRDSEIYRKRETLYGLNCAAQYIARSGVAVIVEGYADVIAIHRADIRIAVASCGTALSTEQADLISRLARVVVVMADGDDAGNCAAQSARAIFRIRGVRSAIIPLPPGDDPDTLIKRLGRDRVLGAIRKAARSTSPKIPSRDIENPDF